MRWRAVLLGAGLFGAMVVLALSLSRRRERELTTWMRPHVRAEMFEQRVPDGLLLAGGQLGHAKPVFSDAGELVHFAWFADVDGGCPEGAAPVKREIEGDRGALRGLPAWTHQSPTGPIATSADCWGWNDQDSALRLCCERFVNARIDRTLIVVDYANSKFAGGINHVVDPIAEPKWDHRNLPLVPPLEPGTWGPVTLGACHPCPPEEAIASPLILRFDRQVCATGFCPDYSVRLHSDGAVEFFGRGNVPTPKYCLGRMTPARLAVIRRALDRADLRGIQTSGFAEDAPAVFLREELGDGGVSKISGDPIDDRKLFELASQLDSLLSIYEWSGMPSDSAAPITRSECASISPDWLFPAEDAAGGTAP